MRGGGGGGRGRGGKGKGYGAAAAAGAGAGAAAAAGPGHGAAAAGPLPGALPPDCDEIEFRDSSGRTVRRVQLSEADREVLPLLDHARAKIADGDPQKAMACLIEAIRRRCGEQGIIPALDQAKDYARRNNEQELLQAAVAAEGTLITEQHGEDGSGAIRHSLETGGSVVCRRCGGVVAADRKEQHSQWWCPARPAAAGAAGGVDEDSDDDGGAAAPALSPEQRQALMQGRPLPPR